MKMTRRHFVGLTVAAAGTAALGSRLRAGDKIGGDKNVAKPQANAGKFKATDRVLLGKSGVRVSLVGIGTGSNGWNKSSNQTRPGDAHFQKLMRHALDSGINFFDLADQYGSNPYFGRAMKGVARDKYVIQTKINSRDPQSARADIERILRELKTDYIDSLIVHCVTEADWSTRFAPLLEEISKFKTEGKIRAHGVTCHSFEALQDAAKSDWVQINMVRWNNYQAHMDNDVENCRALFTQMRRKGQGMIGMKVVGQGDLLNALRPKTPEECFRFQIESGVVDSFVVGCESTSHIDQLLKGTQAALDELGYRAEV